MDGQGERCSPRLCDEGDGNGECSAIGASCDLASNHEQLLEQLNRSVTFADEVVIPEDELAPNSRFDADLGHSMCANSTQLQACDAVCRPVTSLAEVQDDQDFTSSTREGTAEVLLSRLRANL